MSRIPPLYCQPCRKRLYRSEEEARAALGTVMVGHWKDQHRANDYALMVYECKKKHGYFHIGHSSRTIKAIEKWRKEHAERNQAGTRGVDSPD